MTNFSTISQLLRRRKTLLLCAACTLGVLLLLPQTGWLARRQIVASLGGGMAGWENRPEQETARRTREAQVAQQNPDNISLQIAQVVRATEANSPEAEGATISDAAGLSQRKQTVTGLRNLLPRYANHAALHATILRYLSSDAISLENRHEQTLLGLTPAKKDKPLKTGINRPEDLAAWQEAARAGEALEPNNAYFPAMAAVGLFAQNRDADAVEALRRAGEKTGYCDYSMAVGVAEQQLVERAERSEPGVVPRVAIQASILLPHFAQIRSAARLAIVRAVDLEQAGNVEEGFQIRKSVTRLGATMRVRDTTFIGNLVGIAVANIARSRPHGDAPLAKFNNDENGEKRAKAIVTAYSAYLTRIGHAAEAASMRAEAASGASVRQVGRDATENPANIMGGDLRRLFTLTVWWAAGMGVFTNALVILLIGGLAAFAARTRHIRNGLPLSPAVRAGLWVSAASLVGAGMGIIGVSEWVMFAGVLVAGAVGGVALWRACRKVKVQGAMSGRQAVQFAATFFATMGVCFGIVAGIGMLGSWGAMQAWGLGNGLMGWMENDEGLRKYLPALLLGVSCASVPLLMAGIFAVVSKIARVPVSVGIVRGFRGLALPVASALVLLYAGVALFTVTLEARCKADLTKQTTHEGRYYAELAGKPWPK